MTWAIRTVNGGLRIESDNPRVCRYVYGLVDYFGSIKATDQLIWAGCYADDGTDIELWLTVQQPTDWAAERIRELLRIEFVTEREAL